MKSKIFYPLIAILMLSFTSCEQYNREEVEKPMIYSVGYYLDNNSIFKDITELGYYVSVDIRVNEYNDRNELLNIQDAIGVNCFYLKEFRANKLATKVAVSVIYNYYLNDKVSYTKDYWLANVFYLDPESMVRISIDDNTYTTNVCPIK